MDIDGGVDVEKHSKLEIQQRHKQAQKTIKDNILKWKAITYLCSIIENQEDMFQVLDFLLEAAAMYRSNQNTDIFKKLWKEIPDNMKDDVREAMISRGFDSTFWFNLNGDFPEPLPVPQDPPFPENSAFCVYENNPYIVSSTSRCVSGCRKR